MRRDLGIKLFVASLLLVACGNSRRVEPVGSCSYQLVNGTCELRGVKVGELDTGGQPVTATYAWKGALPAGAEASIATREFDWRVAAGEVDGLRARIEAKPEVACQLQLEGGPCPPTLVIMPIDGVYAW